MASGAIVGGRAVEVATPVPVRLTVWGLPAELSVMLSVPFRTPVVVGVKVTLMVQAVNAGKLAPGPPQVLVWAKSPLIVIWVTVRLPLPVLFKLTVLVAVDAPTFWFPKETVVGQKVTAGAAMPLPVRFTDVPSAAIPPTGMMLICPVQLCTDRGRKVTTMVHEPPAAIGDRQLLAIPKAEL